MHYEKLGLTPKFVGVDSILDKLSSKKFENFIWQMNTGTIQMSEDG
jgi:hypothetical protein